MTGFESRITSNISWHLGLKEDTYHRADDIDSNSIMFIKKKISQLFILSKFKNQVNYTFEYVSCLNFKRFNN